MSGKANLPQIARNASDARFDHSSNTVTRNIPLCPKCVSCTGDVLIFIISAVMTYGLPITQFIIGIIHRNDCSMDRFIPIYLIVAGTSGCLALTAVIFWRLFQCVYRIDFTPESIKATMKMSFIISVIQGVLGIFFALFYFAWFIAGNVWVFRAKPYVQFDDPIGKPDTFCDSTVYNCGFWTIIVIYLMIAIACCINCCCRCVIKSETTNAPSFNLR